MSNGIGSKSKESTTSCLCQRPSLPIFSLVRLPSDSETASMTSGDDSSSVSTNDDSSIDLDLEDEHITELKKSIGPAKIPEFEDVVPTEMATRPMPDILKALHQFTVDLYELQISAVDHYSNLQKGPLLSPTLPPRGHVDGGALATTTERKEYLWRYKEASHEERKRVLPRLKMADGTIHVPSGTGYLKVPCVNSPGFHFVESYYTPEVPATIISPDCLGRALGCDGYHTYSDFVNGSALLQLERCNLCPSPNMDFRLQRIRGLLFTDHLIAPTEQEHLAADLPPYPAGTGCQPTEFFPHIRDVVETHSLSVQQKRALWHMRLCHMNDRLVSRLHEHATGIPKLPRADPLSKCPMCSLAKLHKSARMDKEDRDTCQCWQHCQGDYAFFVQRSSGRKKATPPKRKKRGAPVESSASVTTDEDAPDLSKTILALSTGQAPMHIRAVGRDRPPLRRSSRLQAKAPPQPEGPSAGEGAKRGEGSKTGEGNPTVTPESPSTGSSPPKTDEPSPHPDAYGFRRILTHEGPLTSTHKRYYGSNFNLKILWETGETTWEPLTHFFHEAPAEVVKYAIAKGLLSNPYWKQVQEAALGATADHGDLTPEEADEESTYDDETELPTDEAPERPPFVPEPDEVATQKAQAAEERFQKLAGLNGETCYVSITCRHSGATRLAIRRDKTPPLDFFREFISRYGSSRADRSIRFDMGGELGRCTQVHDLFIRAGYQVEVTAPNSSHEIGLAERPHRTIADAVRTMLFAARLELKFWPYALRYWLMINDMIPHGDRKRSPVEICTGTKPNLSMVRVFGARVFVLPPQARDGKASVVGRPGIFLGYRRSMRHAYYWDETTKRVKTARHLTFDEGWNDSTDPPPYVKYLRGELKLEDIRLEDSSADMQISLSPFRDVVDIDCDFKPLDKRPLGIRTGACSRYLRAYVTEFTRPFGRYSVTQANKRLRGGYILKVGAFFTFTERDITMAAHFYAALEVPPTKITIRVAKDQRVTLTDPKPTTPTLRPVDIRRVAALPFVAGEGHAAEQRRRLRQMTATPARSLGPGDPDDEVAYSAAQLLEMRQMANAHMTPEERQLKSFTRKNLMKLPNWAEWNKADRDQLDSHFDSGTIGHPVPRPEKIAGEPSWVFRVVWARLVKASGVRKSRACMDGSKRAAPWLRALVQTYSSCVELPCMRLFLAECANRAYYVSFGDVENAYQQAPPPEHPCYLEIDDTIEDWYLHRFGRKLDRRTQVIPLYKNFQGGPSGGVHWERMITHILVNVMGFRHATHERNLYVGEISGKDILVCRQVDDFATGAAEEETSKSFIEAVRQHVATEYAGMGLPTEMGVYQRYNGVDVIQTRDYIKLGCETYIDRMMQTHGWDTPPSREARAEVPLAPANQEKLQKVTGPPEKTVEARLLEKKHGFSYRNLLGELMYAYVIARPDIGFAVCLLARFSTAPHDDHFQALKAVCKYLRAKKSWGILYWRPRPLEGLPVVPFEFLEEDPNLPAFPEFQANELIGLLDAAHATDLRNRRSVTGLLILFCRAAIAWKSTLQPLCASSSTEAEFYAAVTCAKVIKYLRYVAGDLGFLAPGPSRMFIDNQAALHMINERRPTPRARHIETQYFAIQDWREEGAIVMKHLPGVINASDGLTKAVTAALQSRHFRRAMGHCRVGSQKDSAGAPLVPQAREEAIGAGEGVGANIGPPGEVAQGGGESSVGVTDDVDSEQ